jgi:4-hydroxy-L-threonine phosphate dehydrogenase PdxA
MSKAGPRVAIATGDPAGIGPEISLKAALDPAVQAICRPIVVGDANVIARHARAANITAMLVPIRDIADTAGPRLAVLDVPMPEITDFVFGQNGAAFGRASIASASRAVRAALVGEVDAVVAAPQNETSIAAAGSSMVTRASLRARPEPTRTTCF